VPYGVRRDDERIDYEELAKLADEHRPKMIIAGGSAYPRTLDFPRSGRSPIPWRAAAWWIWRIFSGLVQDARTPTLASMPTSSPPPRTRRSAGLAPA